MFNFKEIVSSVVGQIVSPEITALVEKHAHLCDMPLSVVRKDNVAICAAIAIGVQVQPRLSEDIAMAMVELFTDPTTALISVNDHFMIMSDTFQEVMIVHEIGHAVAFLKYGASNWRNSWGIGEFYADALAVRVLGKKVVMDNLSYYIDVLPNETHGLNKFLMALRIIKIKCFN